MPADLDTAHPGEARLRAALAAAASAPVPPAWDTIRARVVDHEPIVAVGPPVPPTRRGARGALLAAAAVLVVVALVGAIVVETRSQDRHRLTEVGEQVGPPTGWVAPVDLPEGWTVTAVTALRSPERRCPGPGEEPARGIRWVRPGTDATVVLTLDDCGVSVVDDGPYGYWEPGPERQDPAVVVDVGLEHGQAGLAASLEGEAHLLSWQRVVGPTIRLESSGVTVDELLAVGRQVAEADGPDVVPTGFEVADRWTEAPQPESVIEVGLTTDTGLELAYVMGPPGSGMFRDQPDAQPIDLGDRGLDLRRMTFATAPWTALYGASDAAVDITVWARTTPSTDWERGEVLDGPVPDDVAAAGEQLVRSLAPVSTAAWRDLLAAAEDHTPVLGQVSTYADLDDRELPLPVRPPPGPPQTVIAEQIQPPVTTTSTTTTTTAPP